jgi:hypothetical protein
MITRGEGGSKAEGGPGLHRASYGMGYYEHPLGFALYDASLHIQGVGNNNRINREVLQQVFGYSISRIFNLFPNSLVSVWATD